MKIKAVQKDSNGTIQQYKLDDGTVIGPEEAVKMVENKELEGYNVSTARDGSKSIRSNRDDTESNNLDELPEFK